MASWREIEEQVPELAAAVKTAFETGKHKVLATLRSDGAPRVSGTELTMRGGEAWLGSMPGSVKARDLLRDPRFALHSPTLDEELQIGDAKVSGTAIEVTDPEVMAGFVAEIEAEHGESPPEPFHLFKLDITEVVRTTVVNSEYLNVESWHPDRGYTSVRVD